jgi:hypothetical protein
MDDETLKLILTVLQLMGNDASPTQIEIEYMKAGKMTREYRKHLAAHPDEDPRLRMG